MEKDSSEHPLTGSNFIFSIFGPQHEKEKQNRVLIPMVFLYLFICKRNGNLARTIILGRSPFAFLVHFSFLRQNALKSLEQCHMKDFPLLPVNCSSCSLLKRIKRGGSYSPSVESKSLQPCHVKRFFDAQAKSTKGKKPKMPQVAFKDLILKKEKTYPGVCN